MVTGDRVTVQDSSGAVLVRLLEETAVPEVGAVIRVSGLVGTYYGASQLEASSAPLLRGRRSVPVTVLARPPSASDEWLLVRATGAITEVSRSGSAWRAELDLGGSGSLPVAGLASAALAPPAEGGRVTITGLVRRAYPTASDQRLTVVPRSAEDVRSSGPAPTGSPSPGIGTSDGPHPSGSPGNGGSYPAGSASQGGAAVVLATLAELPAFEGRVVRVAGRVVQVGSDSITLEDPTAQAVVRVRDAPFAADLVPELAAVVNATGLVQAPMTPGQAWEIVVASLADVTTPGRVAVTSSAPAAPSGGSASMTVAASIAFAQSSGVPLLGWALLVGSMALLASAGGVLWWRRRRTREGLSQEVVATAEPDRA